MVRKIAFAAVWSLGFLLFACGGGGSDDSTPPPPPPPPPPAADTTPPTVPASVVASAQSATAALITWAASTDATGISGYKIFRDGGATALATVTTPQYTDSTLTASTNYSYTVVAVDSAATPNESAASPAAKVTTSSAAAPAASGAIRILAQRAFPALTFTAAHSLLRAPHDTSRWIVVQQDGHVVAFADNAGVSATSNVLDITDRVVFRNVHGLLGLAFHPDYPSDSRAWVAYTHETSPDVIVLRISVFTSADNGATLNPASEQIVFEMAQPGGHNNGGHLLFGPDGYLYIGPGDGGNDDSNSAQAGNGQLTDNLLGKILRVDVSGTTGSRLYRIPADNPFAANALCNLDGTGSADCPEIFAWGFRNPWRWTFDSATGALWLGDVGSHTREEVNLVTKGGNYGWRCKEGTLDTTLTCGTPATPLTAPVAEYEHPIGQAVTGGFVYHGAAIPALAGRYVFADYSSQLVWSIPTNAAPTQTVTAVQGWDSNVHIASFAQDTDGELFAVDPRDSTIYKLIAAP